MASILRRSKVFLVLTSFVSGLWLALPSSLHAQSFDSLLEILNQVAKPVPNYPYAAEDDLVRKNKDELAEIQRRWANSPRQTRLEKNRFFEEQVKSLNSPAEAWLTAKTASGAKDPRRVADVVLARVSTHPVASIAATATREQSGEIGYCFGRALLVHYLFLKEGIAQSDLVKVFALGELMREKQFWGFHVAVGVRDPVHGFLMVDPLHPTVLPVAQWLKVTAAYDIKNPHSRVRFYPTDPRKFFPAFGAYDLARLNESHLRAYFTDLAASL